MPSIVAKIVTCVKHQQVSTVCVKYVFNIVFKDRIISAHMEELLKIYNSLLFLDKSSQLHYFYDK